MFATRVQAALWGDKDRAEHAELFTTQLSLSQNAQISPESNEEAAHSNDLDLPVNKFIFIVARLV